MKLAAERAKSAKPDKGLFFCVQKHLASHLHYDFRLEHNGVLLSWAVPKGPSLDPKTKRLAMHVEDHPIEYGTFEGVIPSGYGAGIVMLWDQGTWTPESPDVDAALKKGDLKFTLDGYKLKGSWVLVRTGGRYGSRGGDARSWLLIKHRDDWAGDLDITEFAPLSVKSEGDFEDILAADNPDVWISHRPAEGGEAGAMLAKIIERAAALKAGRTAPLPRPRGPLRQPRLRARPRLLQRSPSRQRARTSAKTITKDIRQESTRMKKADVILFSGGAPGAEAEFGACAERHGIEEVNFTFEGHNIARRRGVRVLNHEELQHGDVSLEYVSRLMHRRYTDSPLIRKVLQTLWYQVNNGQEIYVVGVIQADDTVRGGTGWGAEFAKLCNKPLFVFDQEKDGWFEWSGETWKSRTDTPIVTHPHFTGTGTRHIQDNAKRAIETLMTKSFEAAASGTAPQEEDLE